MARRRRNDSGDWEPVIGLVFASVFLLYVASSKPWDHSFGTMALLVVMGVAAVAVFSLFAFPGSESTTTGSPVSDAVAFTQNPFSGKTVAFSPAAPVVPEKSLMRQVAELDWYQFEKLMELVYLKLGYAVERRGGANADGGIDLMIELNGDRTAVQCKHWQEWNVGVKVVREFIGAMTVARVTRGILICPKGFTGEARSLAMQQGIELVDRNGLEQLLKHADADFDPKFRSLFESKEKRCPKCENLMDLRTAKKGRNIGSKFWGCTGYPRCRYTMAV